MTFKKGDRVKLNNGNYPRQLKLPKVNAFTIMGPARTPGCWSCLPDGKKWRITYHENFLELLCP